MENTSLIWGLSLALGIPILMLLLSLGMEYYETRNRAIASLLRTLRNYFLPALALLLVMQQLLTLEDAAASQRIIETLFCIAAILTVIPFVHAFFSTDGKPGPLQISVPRLLFQLIRGLAIAAIAFYALSGVWGIDLSGIVTAVGVGSLALGLALQDTISNLVSGFLLIFASPFKIGDWIEFGGTRGMVVDMNWRAVTLQTFFGNYVVIPNGTLAGGSITNITGPKPYDWNCISVDFSREDMPNDVIRMLDEIALEVVSNRHGGYLDPSPPIVVLSSFEPHANRYDIWFLAGVWYGWGIKSEIQARIPYAAKRYGLTIPLPTEVRVQQQEPEAPNVYQENLAFMRSLPYFAAVAPEAVENAAKGGRWEYYGVQEPVVKEGQPDKGLYLIVEGSVTLTARDRDGKDQEVASLSKGDLFGEMVLFPGQVSPVSIQVAEDLKAIVLNGDVTTRLLEQSPRFALEMNQFVEKRQKAIRLVRGQQETADGDLSVAATAKEQSRLRQIVSSTLNSNQ